MFKVFLTFALFLFFQPCLFSQDIYVVIQATDYETAVSLSKEYKKDVLIVFVGENCSWCKKQKTVFSSEAISRKTGEYIVCYIDINSNKQIAKKYNVRSIPAVFLVDKNEKVLNSFVGYKSEKDFINWLNESK